MDGVIATRDRTFRPCEVNSKRAIFHRWMDGSGIIEFEDGSVHKVKPEDICFLDSDSLFSEQFLSVK